LTGFDDEPRTAGATTEMTLLNPNPPTSDDPASGRLATCSVVLFDAYGTLFDLASIEEATAKALHGVDAGAFATLWRTKQLESSVHRSLLGPGHWVDFRAVTVEALDYALARFGLVPDLTAHAALVAAWETPRPYPETAAVLAALRPRSRAILSNGAAAMLTAAVAAAGLAPRLDAVLSADAAGVFKPHPRVYALGTDHFGVRPNEVCFVSANAWDAAGAGAFGYCAVWINRLGWPPDPHGPPPVAAIGSLAELPALFGSGVTPP
jgi:2-haloacid dehalogenase